MISLSIADKNFVDQIDERNRFPHQICVSHHRVHPIACVHYLLLFDLERSNDFYKGALD
jgi:hypothetical protein